MSTTTILNGNIAANTPSAWVAVPASNQYTIQASSNWSVNNIEFSLDGVNAFSPASAVYTGASITAGQSATLKTPVAFARASSPGGSGVNGVVITVVNA